MNRIIGFFIVLSVCIVGCKKEEIDTAPSSNILLSEDTILFDTIFTDIGSVTKKFKVYNPNENPIIISEISVGGGDNSPYQIRVDGEEGNTHKSVKIYEGDSLFVFVEVTIDPINKNNPILVKDSINFLVNGNNSDIKLVAFGQDVHLYNNEFIETETWTNTKPYLVYNNASIDSNKTLTIEKGTRVYFHNRSSLVVMGELFVKGTLEEPVIFTNDRFDERYRGSAGQWGTVFFHPVSKGSILEYLYIKNAVAGIQLGSPGQEETPSIELRNCMISNSSGAGIYSFGGKINAYNTIIADCGQFAVAALNGGDYNFYHCTISNIGAYYPDLISGGYESRSEPSLIATNYFVGNDVNDKFEIVEKTFKNDLTAFNFFNSIIYGENKNEFIYDSVGTNLLNYAFENCILKAIEDSLNFDNETHFKSVILNKDPKFMNDSISEGDYNFQLDTLSPAKDMGSLNIVNQNPVLMTDFNGNDRTLDQKPDLGAFERYE